MEIDPVAQAERWLVEYTRQFDNVGTWAQHPPRHSICFSLIRSLFEAGFAIEDLERILQALLAEKCKPKSYVWLRAVIVSRVEDMAHEREAAK